MFNPYAHLEVPVPEYLAQLLSIDNKADLEKFARTIEISRRDFAILIWNAATLGYYHQIQYYDFRPEHLEPTKESSRLCQEPTDSVNTIFANRRLQFQEWSRVFHPYAQ